MKKIHIAMVLGFSSVLVACGVDTTEELASCDAGTCSAAGSAGSSGASGTAGSSGSAGTGGSAGAGGDSDGGQHCIPGEQHKGCCPTNPDAYQVCQANGLWGSDCIGCGGTGGSAGAGGSAGTGGSNQVCQPGLIETCTAGCPAGQVGQRACAQDGMSWSACSNCQNVQQHYADKDGDGHGDPNSPVSTGGVTSSDDCDDNDPSRHPGATELCDGKDNDCDNTIDEGCGSYTYHKDADGDGLGDPNSVITSSSPTPPAGYVSNANDCDDTNASIGASASRSCTGAGNCAGTQTCSNGVWSSCVCNQSDAGALHTMQCKYTSLPSAGSNFLRLKVWDHNQYLDPKGNTPAGCQVSSGTTFTCSFQVTSGDVVKLQAEVGFRFWGDTSGFAPAPCIPESNFGSLKGASITIMGTLECSLDGAPATGMYVHTNDIVDPNYSVHVQSCAGESLTPYLDAYIPVP